jgi:RNA recognition motif-containing protein
VSHGLLFVGKKKLYVGNLPFDASYEDLKDYFGEYGVVHDLFIPMQDGSARGFAFVTMDEDAADMAIRELNGKEFMGRPCYVSEPLNKGEKGTYKAKQQRQCE